MSIRERFTAIENELAESRGSYKSLQRTLEDKIYCIAELDKQIEDRTKDIVTVNKCGEVLKEYVRIVSTYGLNQYVELINRGLSTIFSDRKYEFKVEVEDRGKMKRVFMLLREEVGGEWENWRNIDTSIGGSVGMMVDLITRIYIIVATKRRRFLVFDESLLEVSVEYREKTIEFLETICSDMGFDIVFLTHDETYLQYSKRKYEMQMGEAKLVEVE